MNLNFIRRIKCMCVGHSISPLEEDILETREQFETICYVCEDPVLVKRDVDPDYFIIEDLEGY